MPEKRTNVKHVFEVTTGFGLVGLVTMIEKFGLGNGPEDRILVVANNVPVPEAVVPLHLQPEYRTLVAEFGEVVYLNDLCAPLHPSQWFPPPASHYARLAAEDLRRALGVDAPVRLYVESIQAPPSRALALLLDDAEINVYSDGLMSYGPTRVALEPQAGHRVRRVYHLDLVPEVRPYLLREFDPEYVPFSVAEFAAVAERAAAHFDREYDPAIPTAVVLGQYLADLDLLTEAEDARLLSRMVDVAVEAGYERVLVRPHPRATRQELEDALAHVRGSGVDVRVMRSSGLAENLFTELDIRLVVSCFTTALFTAKQLGIETRAVGADFVLERLQPYENSNRIPLVLASLLHRNSGLDPAREYASTGTPLSPAEAEFVVGMTAFSMQPTVLAFLSGELSRLRAAAGPRAGELVRRYVPKRLRNSADPTQPPLEGSRWRNRLGQATILQFGWRIAKALRTRLPAGSAPVPALRRR